MTNDTKIALGGNIKMIGDNRVGGYLIYYTDADNKDLTGEYFTKATNQYEEHYPTVGLKVLFHHGLKAPLKVIPIGTIVKAENRDVGLWVEAILEEYGKYKEYVAAIKGLAQKGILSWSSGALPASVEVDGDTGFIKSWGKIEGSMTHTPAMPEMTKIHTLKSVASWLETLPESKEVNEPKETRESVLEPLRDLSTNVTKLSNDVLAIKDSLNMSENKAVKMTDEERDDIVKQVVSQVMSKLNGKMEGVDDEAKSKMEAELEEEAKAKMDNADDSEDKTAKALSAVLDALPRVVQKAIDARANTDDQINKGIESALGNSFGKSQAGMGSYKNDHIGVSEDLRFAYLSAEEMQLNYMLHKSFNPMSKVPGKPTLGKFFDDEMYLKHMAHKSLKQEEKLSRYEDVVALKSAKPFKADEINASDIAGQGDEWVGIHYSTNLWEKARNRRIFQTLMSKGMMEVEVPQGHESTYVLTEGSDPTVFTRQQANDLNANTGTTRIQTTAVPQGIGTGRELLTPGELSAMVGVTYQAVEDSIIPFLPQVNRQLQETMLEHIDKAMINADSITTATTNINLIDGTPSATITSKPYYLVTNGFLKYALVTGSDTSRDGGALDETDYRLTYSLMPTEIREQRERLVFIIDSDTHDASLDIAAIKTDDVRRTNATITSGIIENIYGVDVLRTGFMPLANSVGKVPAGGGTLGRILCVYAPYWAIGWKREITFEYDRDIYSATNLILVSMRLGMVARGAGASTVSYNLTV